MRAGQYQTPGIYHNTDEQYGAYPDMPLDLLTDHSSSLYDAPGAEPGFGPGYDHRAAFSPSPSQASQTIEPWSSTYWNGAIDPQSSNLGFDEPPRRHNRSLSFTGDAGYGSSYSTPERRLRPAYPGSGGIYSQNMGGMGQQAQPPRGFNTAPFIRQPFPSPQGAGGQNANRGDVNRGDGERGQGYRKLWQAVTKVGRGQKLGENAEGMPFSDMTVEDLLRIIRNLSPEESAVQAVSSGLYYLDSRALAALLKELHKLGLTNRAGELFDWLKGLPDGHELAHLCDVYTYTTIISQCGSHQQLRKALELVAEMRSKGIPCNVHTYSALMNVCIKANEMELALDVYNQLLRDGCVPNLVTYNILIDVHGKTGNWREAVKVLDALENQGTKPEVRTYNTIINACNRSQQPEHALKVYERMIADGTQPTATTYTALISAYGKTGKIEDAIKIFQDMIHRGCERNVITYSSLISACEKSGKWELALELFEEMHKDACKPNIVTYNALIAACGQGGQWETAMSVFNGMDRHNCKPDSITYSMIISAYDRGGEWSRALQAYEEMQNHGHRPDVGVYNILVDILSRLGSQPAYIKSIQLFQTATRQGQFRMMTQGQSDTTAIAFTAGAATLALLQWLQDLRAQSNSGPHLGSPRTSGNASTWSSPAQPPQNPNRTSGSPPGGSAHPETASSGGSGSERVHLVLLKGKHGRSESSPEAIEHATSSVLTAAKIPYSMEQTQQGLRIGVDVEGTQSWQNSKELEIVLAPITSPSLRRISIETLISEDRSIDLRCRTAFAGVQAYEDTHAYSEKVMSKADIDNRRSLVEVLVDFCQKAGFQEESVHDSVQLLDRLLFQNLGAHNLSQVILFAAIARILIQQAKKTSGSNTTMPSISSIETASGLTSGQIEQMEEYVCKALAQDTGTITAFRVLHMYLERLSVDFQDPVSAQRVAGNALQAISNVIYESNLAQYPPSVVAASVLYLARKQAGTYPFWPLTLANLTGYHDPKTGALAEAIKHAAPLFPSDGVQFATLPPISSAFSASKLNPVSSRTQDSPATTLSSINSAPQPSPSGIRRSTSSLAQGILLHTRSGGLGGHLRNLSLGGGPESNLQAASSTPPLSGPRPLISPRQ